MAASRIRRGRRRVRDRDLDPRQLGGVEGSHRLASAASRPSQAAQTRASWGRGRQIGVGTPRLPCGGHHPAPSPPDNPELGRFARRGAGSLMTNAQVLPLMRISFTRAGIRARCAAWRECAAPLPGSALCFGVPRRRLGCEGGCGFCGRGLLRYLYPQRVESLGAFIRVAPLPRSGMAQRHQRRPLSAWSSCFTFWRTS